ncbi:MAG: ABC transporter substrate-binding protein [Alphaproteobacteria bacterium]
MSNRHKVVQILRVVFFLLTMIIAPFAHAADKITVGSKIDTEGSLLGNVIVLMLEKGGYQVTSKVQLGPTNIVRAAIISGEIDIYPEYTGNGAFFFGPKTDPAWKNADTAYSKVKAADFEKNKLVWLARAPANNTWAIAIRRDLSATNNLKTMEDFARWVNAGGKVKLAGSAEFVESPLALPSFQEAYGFKLTSDQLVVLSGGDTAATIKAAAEQISGVNTAMAYGTDGALAALGLVVLTDTKGAQAVYEPAPVIRASVLDKNPKIKDLLDPVFQSFTLETLQNLNAKIAVEGQDAKKVARDYLTQKKFLP